MTDMSSELKQKTDMHWARKIWHMMGVSTIAIVFHFLAPFWSGVGLVLLWCLTVPVDLLRLRNPHINELMLHAFGPIMRRSERDQIAGTSYLSTGILLTFWIFPRDIFQLTLLYLAFADPIASIIGIQYGRDKIFGQKSLQGSFAAFVVCAVLSFAFFLYKGLLLDHILVVSVLGGVIGSLAEALPIAKLDDNFTIPVISAIGLWILFLLFGGLSF